VGPVGSSVGDKNNSRGEATKNSAEYDLPVLSSRVQTGDCALCSQFV